MQKRLYEEVSSVLKPDELATPATLQKMPFLRGCIKETLRYGTKARSKHYSIHAPNLTDELSAAEERRLNQFGSAG